MSETILLRPGKTLADAMTAAAESRGISRQAWMLAVLSAACSEYASPITPDDVPLFVMGVAHTCTSMADVDQCLACRRG